MVNPCYRCILPEALSVLSSLYHFSLSSLALVPLTGRAVRPRGTITKQSENQILSPPDLFVLLFSLAVSCCCFFFLGSPPGGRDETPF